MEIGPSLLFLAVGENSQVAYSSRPLQKLTDYEGLKKKGGSSMICEIAS
jgi:hypothetical protein